MKPLPRPTRYSRQHCGGAGALDRVVQGMPAPSRRDDRSVGRTETPVLDWREWLVCSRRDSRPILW
jgi:hypothetical protein